MAINKNAEIIKRISSLVDKAYKKFWTYSKKYSNYDVISNWVDYVNRNDKIFLKHWIDCFWWDYYHKWKYICQFTWKWDKITLQI